MLFTKLRYVMKIRNYKFGNNMDILSVCIARFTLEFRFCFVR